MVVILTLKPAKKFVLCLILALFFTLSATAYAQITSYVTQCARGNYYQYDYRELLNSYTSYLMDPVSPGAGYYLSFSQEEVVAIHDSSQGYVDYADILSAYTSAVIYARPFDLDSYIASEARPITLPGVYEVAAGEPDPVEDWDDIWGDIDWDELWEDLFDEIDWDELFGEFWDKIDWGDIDWDDFDWDDFDWDDFDWDEVDWDDFDWDEVDWDDFDWDEVDWDDLEWDEVDWDEINGDVPPPVVTDPVEDTGIPQEETLYGTIREALTNAEAQVNIAAFPESASSQQVFEVVNTVVEENPEILYYTSSNYRSDGLLQFSYKRDQATSLRHLEELRQKAESIIAREITPGMNDFEKVLAVHDYIINNARYDTDVYTARGVEPESYSAYGVLIRGKGVCESYAKAMKLLLDRLGIHCLYVSGKADGEGHAWNMVKLGGDYYHLDATWNDPVTEDGSQVLRHDYFNITDEEIAPSHSWDRGKYPACTATRYNYYHYFGLVARSYDEFYRAVKETLQGQGETLGLRILDYDPVTYNITDTVNAVMQDNPGLVGRISYSFTVPKNHKIGVISINFTYQ